jgi:hypothetical protein
MTLILEAIAIVMLLRLGLGKIAAAAKEDPKKTPARPYVLRRD